MQLFFATRLFPSRFGNNDYICNKCRLMYTKWKALPEFNDFPTMIDDGQTVNESSSDNQSVDDATNDDNMKDEEILSYF
jgi:hypothetical protein